MIDLYTTGTANGHKASIMLEECGLPYHVHDVNLVAGEHMTDRFLELNPGGKIPVIVDPDGPDGSPMVLAQSLAIAWYLAEKTGKLLPRNARERAEAMRYMALVASDVSAAFSGLFTFTVMAPEPQPFAVRHFQHQGARNLHVLDQRLGQSRYLAGDAYTLADVLALPVAADSAKRLPGELAPFPNLQRWAEELMARPAVQRGLAVPAA